MARPVTLFTGQWADLSLEDLCKKARDFGYDGLELACWGDHFEVDKALSDDTYCARKRDLLERHDLKLFAISNHLVGQAVLDNIDERHQAILPDYVWGNGDPVGVNERAIDEMKNTAGAAQCLGAMDSPAGGALELYYPGLHQVRLQQRRMPRQGQRSERVQVFPPRRVIGRRRSIQIILICRCGTKGKTSSSQTAVENVSRVNN